MLKRKINVVTSDGAVKALPLTEYLVFATLADLHAEHGPVHGPAIARASNGELTVATVYGSLERLRKKGVVDSNEELFEIGPSKVRRVLWCPRATATETRTPKKANPYDVIPLPEPA